MRISKRSLQIGSHAKPLLLPSPSPSRSSSGDDRQEGIRPRLSPQSNKDFAGFVLRRRPIRPAAAHLAQLSLQYDAIEQLRADRRERRLRAAQSYIRSIETSRQKPPAGTHIRRVA